MKHWLPQLIALAVLVAAEPARAQPTAAVTDQRAAWTEVGFGETLIAAGEGGAAFPSAIARVNVTRHDAVDVTAAFYTGKYSRGLSGFYILQGRHTFPARQSGAVPYVTYGAIGNFTYRRYPESRYVLPTGDTIVYPQYAYHELTKPLAYGGGGGARARLASHAYIEVGGELYACRGGVVLVGRAGLTVPIGPRR